MEMSCLAFYLIKSADNLRFSDQIKKIDTLLNGSISC